MKRPTKDQLLQHYARRPPQRFTQLDGFTGVRFDDVMRGDEMHGDKDGHALMCSETYELMSGVYAVRLLVTAGTQKHDVLALLDKMRRWIARDDIVGAPPPKLAIKFNNALSNDPCALCGARTDPSGVDLFLEESWSLVCDACGDKHAPELMRALRMGHNPKPSSKFFDLEDLEDLPF